MFSWLIKMIYSVVVKIASFILDPVKTIIIEEILAVNK